MRSLLVLIGSCLLCFICIAASENPPVKAAYAEYSAAVASADAACQKSVSKAAKTYIEALNHALAVAMKAQDLDRANAIKAERDKFAAQPDTRKPGPAGLVIVSAKYGRETKWVDVTDFVKSCVKDGRLTIPGGIVNAANVSDPIGGFKYVDVQCRFEGKSMRFEVFDGAGPTDITLSATPEE